MLYCLCMTSEKNILRMQKKLARDPALNFIPGIAKKYPESRWYLVGGMVRDLFLGKDSKDYDIVACGVPKKTLQSELEKLGSVNLVGKHFGVFKFLPRASALKETIDIALPRTEYSFKTGAYRDVKVNSSHLLPIEKDLERRDFTINAMALELTKKQKIKKSKKQLTAYNLQLITGLIDPFGGLKDLKKKIIRCVGKPEERFKEDYSRMLRALRFSVQLGFSIEKHTWKAIKKHIKKTNEKSGGEYIVPREGIAKELAKMLASNPISALHLLDESKILKELFPEFLKMKKCPQPGQFHTEGDVWKHTLLALNFLYSKKFAREFPISNSQFLNKSKNRNSKTLEIGNLKLEIPPEVIWALLFHDLGKPYTIKYAERIRFDGHDAKSAQLWRGISERLKLASAGIDAGKIEKLIAKHMFLTNAKLESVKETTLEKYFFSKEFPGRELLMLMFADVSATIPPSGKPDYKNYKKLKRRLVQLEKKILTRQNSKVKDILDGNEIMKTLQLTPGKKVGEIKQWLREQQLKGKIKTKEEAKWLIKKFKIHGQK